MKTTALALCAVLLLAAGCSDDDDPGADQGPGDAALADGPSADTTVDANQAKLNSGALCNSSKPCPDPNDECYMFSSRRPSATHGMCLGKCNKIKDACFVTHQAKQLSICWIQMANYKLCLHFCEQDGKSYSCPNDTDYVCELWKTTEPNTKVCMPKN